MYMYEIRRHARDVQIEENKAKYACVCALKGYSEYGSRSRMQSATKLVQIGVNLLDDIIARHILR